MKLIEWLMMLIDKDQKINILNKDKNIIIYYGSINNYLKDKKHIKEKKIFNNIEILKVNEEDDIQKIIINY